MKDIEIKKAIKKYTEARKAIIQISRKYPHELSGNDNIIGRIGEYIAILFLEGMGQKPRKTPHSNTQGFDLIEKNIKTQVKIITSENIAGRDVRLKEPWEQLVFVQLDKNYDVEKIGYLRKEEFNKAIKENKKYSRTPYVKRTMLGKKGLIGRYGRIIENFKY